MCIESTYETCFMETIDQVWGILTMFRGNNQDNLFLFTQSGLNPLYIMLSHCLEGNAVVCVLCEEVTRR